MKAVVIQAYKGSGEERQKVGEKEVMFPENFDELAKTVDHEKIYEDWFKIAVIRAQDALRRGDATGLDRKTKESAVKQIIEQASKDAAFWDIVHSTTPDLLKGVARPS